MFGPYRVGEVAKGPKNGEFKQYTFYTWLNWQFLCEKLPTRFLTIGLNKGELLFEYWELLFTKKKSGAKIKFGKKKNLGPKFFPDFETQIGQQHFFIIRQEPQTPHQLCFTNVSPNGSTVEKMVSYFCHFGPMTHFSQSLGRFLGPKKILSVPGQICNIFVKTTKTFLKILPNKPLR